MTIEAKRLCGYRKVGGLYLVGGGLAAPCDRLPLPITPCPTCGEEPRFSRGIAKITPLKLWGNHPALQNVCHDPTFCSVCYPEERGWLMWTGKEYTPESFIAEAQALGVSKRIHQLPKDLRVGEDWVYLAYWHLIPQDGHFKLLSDGDPRRGWGPGVFYAFRPTAVEKIVTESMAKDEASMEKLKDQGVTPVAVPDDDPDHRSRGGGG